MENEVRDIVGELRQRHDKEEQWAEIKLNQRQTLRLANPSMVNNSF